MAVKLYNSKAWLYKKHVKDKMSVEEIAKEAGCARKTIYQKLNEYGLVRKK